MFLVLHLSTKFQQLHGFPVILLTNKLFWACFLHCLLGGRPPGEDAEHGEVSSDGHGHGPSRGQEKPEQLEFTFPLVTVETTIRPGKKPRWLPVWPVRCVQPSWQHARRPLHRYHTCSSFRRILPCSHHPLLTKSPFWFVPTAYCKNSIDGQWYCFDDSEVLPVADDDVCQQMAYILFYQRRTAIPSWSANSSVAGHFQSPPVCLPAVFKIADQIVIYVNKLP